MRICRKCLILAPDTESGCPKCGAPLETAYPHEIKGLAAGAEDEARREKRKQTVGWFVLVPLLAVVAILVFWETAGGSDSSTPKYRTAAFTCLCATTRDDVVPVARSYQSQDIEAQIGLLARGAAFRLQEGTKVFVAGTYSGVAAVLVESGVNSGRECYLPETFLKTDSAASDMTWEDHKRSDPEAADRQRKEVEDLIRRSHE